MADGSSKRVNELEHQLLSARDEAIGLRAELEQLRKRLDVLKQTPAGELMTRIDDLESERQSLYDFVTVSKVGAEESLRVQAAQFRGSRTWRAGQLALSPVKLAARLVHRR